MEKQTFPNYLYIAQLHSVVWGCLATPWHFLKKQIVCKGRGRKGQQGDKERKSVLDVEEEEGWTRGSDGNDGGGRKRLKGEGARKRVLAIQAGGGSSYGRRGGWSR